MVNDSIRKINLLGGSQMTIYYEGKLKRTCTPEDVFAKIEAFAKPKGNTKLWLIQKAENCLTVDFCDGKSETLIFDFKEKEIDGFCKVAFDDAGSEQQLEAFFNLFYSLTKMFSHINISDDYGLWDDYVDSKRFKIQLRELTNNEIERVKRLFDNGICFYKKLIYEIISDDIHVPYEKLDCSNFVVRSFQNGKWINSEYKHYNTCISYLNEWLDETAAYKNRGRIKKYKVTYWHGGDGYRWKGEVSEVSELEFAIAAFIYGLSKIFAANFKDYRRVGGIFGQKDGQVERLFKDKFIPLINSETDEYMQCILVYRFMVSIYEYCGFVYVGKSREDHA
jgi:hypothetical protein